MLLRFHLVCRANGSDQVTVWKKLRWLNVVGNFRERDMRSNLERLNTSTAATLLISFLDFLQLLFLYRWCFRAKILHFSSSVHLCIAQCTTIKVCRIPYVIYIKYLTNRSAWTVFSATRIWRFPWAVRFCPRYGAASGDGYDYFDPQGQMAFTKSLSQVPLHRLFLHQVLHRLLASSKLKILSQDDPVDFHRIFNLRRACLT